MTDTDQRWCLMCAQPNTGADIACDACNRKLYLQRHKLVEIQCDECGKVSEVYNHGKSIQAWRCQCQRRKATPRSRRKNAQDFNRNAKLDNVMSLFIDHDHESGAVRGLLCHACNVGLGHLGVDGRGDVERLESALAYIKAFRTSSSPIPDKTCR